VFDGELFGRQVVEIVRSYVDAQVAPLREENDDLKKRLADMEARELPPGVKGDPGEPGRDGVVDMEAVKALVHAAVASLPPAERGEPGQRGDDGLNGEKGADGPPGEPGQDGKDGIGLADALKDADGNLVLVMTNGRTKRLGRIDGQNGEPGKDGRDGLGFDDLNVEQIGERTIRFLLKRGADAAEFDLNLPVPIYRGVFKEAEPYEVGDLVTWAGSLWHCNEPKGLKPGVPDSGWQLAVKAGRPGKDMGK